MRIGVLWCGEPTESWSSWLTKLDFYVVSAENAARDFASAGDEAARRNALWERHEASELAR